MAMRRAGVRVARYRVAVSSFVLFVTFVSFPPKLARDSSELWRGLAEASYAAEAGVFPVLGVAAAADVYRAPGGVITITPFIHSSIQIEHAGRVIHVDPWGQGDLSAARPADLILITDDPGHHLDVKAIARVRKPGAPIVIPRGVEATPPALKAVPDGLPMGNGETREIAGFRVEAIAAYDLTPGEPYHPKGEANGYVVTVAGARLYVAGVTECVPEIRALKNVDVVFFPLNLPLARMEPAAAIECLKGLAPKVVYPYHYDQDWVTAVGRGQPRPAPTTRGLDQLKAALGPSGIEVRVAEWYPAK